MTSPILLTGGTGTLGCLVAPQLRDAGCAVQVLSRRSHESAGGVEFVTGDLATGEGIDAAVKGSARSCTALVAPRAMNTTRKLVRAAPGRCAAPGLHLGRRR